MKRSVWVIAAVVLGSAAQAHGQGQRPGAPRKFSSEAANAAEAEYRREVAEADATRKERLDRARAKLTPVLEAAKGAASRSENLDEAVALRDRIKELSQEPAPAEVGPERRARRDLAEAIQDTVWLGSPHGPVTFGRDGLIRTGNKALRPWRWEAVDRNTVVARFEAGNIDVFFFDLPRGVVEAYHLGVPTQEQHNWTARRTGRP